MGYWLGGILIMVGLFHIANSTAAAVSAARVHIRTEGVMGSEENSAFWKRSGIPSDRLTLGEIWEQEERQRKAEYSRMIENAIADAKAIWLLADYCMPSDVKEAAKRWGMEQALIEMWRGAFIEGWRSAQRGR